MVVMHHSLLWHLSGCQQVTKAPSETHGKRRTESWKLLRPPTLHDICENAQPGRGWRRGLFTEKKTTAVLTMATSRASKSWQIQGKSLREKRWLERSSRTEEKLEPWRREREESTGSRMCTDSSCSVTLGWIWLSSADKCEYPWILSTINIIDMTGPFEKIATNLHPCLLVFPCQYSTDASPPPQ